MNLSTLLCEHRFRHLALFHAPGAKGDFEARHILEAPIGRLRLRIHETNAAPTFDRLADRVLEVGIVGDHERLVAFVIAEAVPEQLDGQVHIGALLFPMDHAGSRERDSSTLNRIGPHVVGVSMGFELRAEQVGDRSVVIVEGTPLRG